MILGLSGRDGKRVLRAKRGFATDTSNHMTAMAFAPEKF
jgi:hypothetical protein